ncbi:phage tail protein [Oharaeibacter diazotrophicus]|uniref:Microcystin-dependent protein n=1 Tax=Oharaeibacter diazotrophicus TaxID=1920512 RepID=A0A4R6RN10_9HYPH|nr:tail fiber protein [Oharaeibacter diazotrophicus]TDP87437.1 microcystin-dependent protein [Oharaeibacter diazotrophicus]BBE70619.1 phage tail collar domain protein [Pleomorphomonas sp. SM30]GLS77365.1 tail protein [Oharaeibacter diazotrophicus]
MAEPFVGEIKMWAFPWAPVGWALCDGSMLPARQYPALYSLLLNSFGGDANYFALPDLRGRTPVGIGAQPVDPTVNYTVGTKGGQETVALSEKQAPTHTHAIFASGQNGNQVNPGGNNFGRVVPTTSSSVTFNVYQPHGASDPITNPRVLDSSAIDPVGGNGHDNMQPFLTLNFAIALTGYYPPRP